jgi:hypothetical protein
MFICNNCDIHGCKVQPETRNNCMNHKEITWIKRNTMGEELLHKSAKSADTTLKLLHKHEISWKRYTK